MESAHTSTDQSFFMEVVEGCSPFAYIRLQGRGVPSSDYCPFCETNYENDWHIFIGCEVGKQVWIEARLWDTITAGIGSATGLAAHLFSIFCRLPNELCRDIAALLWCLWRDISVGNVLKHQKYGEQKQGEQHNIRWLPPEEGFVKCNVDIALLGDQKCFGIGLCIRNSQVRSRNIVKRGQNYILIFFAEIIYYNNLHKKIY